MENQFDQYVARFQNLPPFNIHAITPDGMADAPWFEVTQSVVKDLVIDELRIPEQVDIIAAEIQKWGRLSALSKRVWELEERGYRSWRSAFLIKVTDPSDKSKEWKKPTSEICECLYRVDPEYVKWQVKIERAEEAYNATDAVLQAFRAKKDMLMKFAQRHREDGASPNL